MRFGLTTILHATALIGQSVVLFGSLWGSLLAGGVIVARGTGRSRAIWPASILLIGLVFIALRPSVGSKPLPPSHRCKMRVHVLAHALRAYVLQHGRFPPQYVTNEHGVPWHSWRVLLLPYLGEKELYDRYRFDEPWNGPHNRQLLDLMPTIYQCPCHGGNVGHAHFAALIVPNSIWHQDKPETLPMAASLCESSVGIPWLQPVDLTPSEIVFPGTAWRRAHAFRTWWYAYVPRMTIAFTNGWVRSLAVPESKKDFAQWQDDLTMLATNVEPTLLDLTLMPASFPPRLRIDRILGLIVFVTLCFVPGPTPRQATPATHASDEETLGV